MTNNVISLDDVRQAWRAEADRMIDEAAQRSETKSRGDGKDAKQQQQGLAFCEQSRRIQQ